jgi:hypothetical protein
MSKVLSATCEAGVVKVEGLAATDVIILAEGLGASTGVLIMQDGQAYYVPYAAIDLKNTLIKIDSTLTNVIDAINKIGDTLVTIGSGMTGPTTAPPGTLAADVLIIKNYAAVLGTVKTDFAAIKDELK